MSLHSQNSQESKPKQEMETPLDLEEDLPRHNTNRTLDAGESMSRMSQYEEANSSEDYEKQEANDDKPLEEIPDGGRGWLVVLGVFLLNFGSWGANSGFAIYLNYDLSNHVFKGATKVDYALIGGFALGLGIIFCPFINYLQGILGTRGLILLGNILQFAGVFMASFTKKLWQLYLTQGVLNSFGLACISLPAITLLPQWFKKRRTFAGGLGTGGSGIGGIVFNLGMQKVLQARSVWWALRAQSILCLGIISIGILLVKARTERKIEFTAFDKQVAKCAGFYLLVIFVITCMFGYAICLYTMVNFTVSLGYTPYQGSIASAMVQVGSFFGRPTVGLISDKVGALSMGCIVYILTAVFTLGMWLPARNYATIIAFSIIIGLIMGSIYGILPVIVARLVGLKKLNVTFSMIWLFVGGAGIASPVIGLVLTTNSIGPDKYTHCIIFAGCSFAVSALCLIILRGYIIARDKIANGESDPDMGQLHYTVPFHQPFMNFYKSTGSTKV